MKWETPVLCEVSSAWKSRATSPPMTAPSPSTARSDPLGAAKGAAQPLFTVTLRAFGLLAAVGSALSRILPLGQ